MDMFKHIETINLPCSLSPHWAFYSPTDWQQRLSNKEKEADNNHFKQLLWSNNNLRRDKRETANPPHMRKSC